MKPSPKNRFAKKLLGKSLETPPPWANAGVSRDIRLGLAARIYRNIPGVAFPGWSTAEDRRKVYDTLAPVLLKNKTLDLEHFIGMPELGLAERRVLLERKYLSPCMAARQDGCYAGRSRRGDISVLINEEEHLVVRGFTNGSDPEKSFGWFCEVASSIDDSFSFARDPQLGVLSSNPAETGDGIQFYCVLHLPGLNLAGAIEQVVRAAEKLGLSLMPFHGSEDNSGHCYLLGTAPVRPGKTQAAIGLLNSVTEELEQREWETRFKLLCTRIDEVLDVIGRSYGLLLYAHRLSHNELLHNASILRLGAALGVIVPYELPHVFLLSELLAEMVLHLSPGAMEYSAGITDEDEQERARAQAFMMFLDSAGVDFLSPLIESTTAHE